MIAETTDHLINSGGISFDGTSKDSRHRYSIFASAQATNRESYYGAGQDPNAYGKTNGVTAVTGAQYLFRTRIFELTTGIEYNYDYLFDDPVGYVNMGFTSMQTIQHIHNVSVLAQGEFKFEKWGFLVGGRLDNWYNASAKKFLCIPSPRVTLPPYPLVIISLFSTSVTLLLFC